MNSARKIAAVVAAVAVICIICFGGGVPGHPALQAAPVMHPSASGTDNWANRAQYRVISNAQSSPVGDLVQNPTLNIPTYYYITAVIGSQESAFSNAVVIVI
jgi:hypothetical protein